MVAAILHFDKGAGMFGKAAGKVGRSVADGHDVGDPHARGFGNEGAGQEGSGGELFTIAQHLTDFGHGREHGGIGLGGAAGDEDAGIGAGAVGAPDRLPGLAHRLVGDGAAVDDDEVVLTDREAAHGFAFGDVEAAAERDQFGA